MSEAKKSYIVYVYVDYRKETGTVVMRSYLDRQKAIDFAETLSTKYTPPEEAKQNDEDDEDEDGDRNNGMAEYVSIVGTEFDAQLKLPKEKLAEYGVKSEHLRDLWYTRIAVSVAEHFD